MIGGWRHVEKQLPPQRPGLIIRGWLRRQIELEGCRSRLRGDDSGYGIHEHLAGFDHFALAARPIFDEGVTGDIVELTFERRCLTPQSGNHAEQVAALGVHLMPCRDASAEADRQQQTDRQDRAEDDLHIREHAWWPSVVVHALEILSHMN